MPKQVRHDRLEVKKSSLGITRNAKKIPNQVQYEGMSFLIFYSICHPELGSGSICFFIKMLKQVQHDGVEVKRC